ncbi:MAG: tetratricopeptide repeat protein [Desulfobacterales bacterium]
MKCRKCRFENPAGAKFCNECGIKLELACPQCGQVNPPGSRFCNECGRNLAQPSAPSASSQTVQQLGLPTALPETVPLPEGERRQATIVFSDLSGYTSMNERFDPEEVEAVMSRIKKEAVRIVESHEGIVNQFVGDEILSIFGVPTAHEDDPMRAVRAAFEIHEMVRKISPGVDERIGTRLCMHTGISTGLVVTHIRDIREGRYGITGDTVNIGSRLATQAGSDEILVDPETHDIIAAYFETEALEAVTVKGKTQPLVPHRLKGASGVQTRFEAATLRGLSKFTGRVEELAALHSCLEKAIAGNGQFVTVMGEAGAGKSRMIYEFRHSVDKNRITVLQGRCQAHSISIPYFPHINALKRGLNLNEKDTPADLVEKTISNALAIDPSLKQYLPFFLHLLSVPSNDYPLPEHMEGRELKYAFQEALAAIATLSSKRRPMVLIFEDWHWTDKASDTALRYMVAVISQYPLMILVTYRPDYNPSWSGMSNHTPISLKPLDTLHTENIIKSIFAAKDLSPGVGEFIQTRTGGNPLYIEEVCRELNEEGLLVTKDGKAVLTSNPATLSLPSTLQAIINSRLDRLEPDTKETIRLAAVIGKEFSRRIIERLYQAQTPLSLTLEKLSVLEMIQQTQIVPEPRYRFKHVLTQEVAYDTLLLKRRKELHRLVGNAIEELFQDRLEEHLELLMYHYALAENWRKAVHFGCQAAEKTRRLSQFQDAVKIYEEVLVWLGQLPDDLENQEIRIDILLQQERLYEILGQREHQQKIIHKLLSKPDIPDDPARLAEVKIRQGDLFTQLGQFDKAEHALQEALRIRRQISDSAGESHALRSIGFLRWHQNRCDEAVAMNEAALMIDRQRNDLMAVATDLTNLGAVRRNMGAYRQAIQCFEDALDIYKSTNNPHKQAFTRYSIAHVHREQGELDLAAQQYQQAHDIFAKHRDPVMASRALAGMASILWEQGKPRESLDLYQHVVQITREVKYAHGLSHALRAIGELLVVLNEPREALDYLLESTDTFAELKDPKNEAETWRKIAEIYEQVLKDCQNAFSARETELSLRRMLNDGCGSLKTLQLMGNLAWRHFADPTRALQYYLEAFDLALRLNNHQKQAELLSSMANIEWHQGANIEALNHYEEAYKIYQELGDIDHKGLMLNSIGATLRKLGRLEDALRRLHEAVATNRQAGQRLLEAHSLAAIGDACRDMGNHDQALNHYRASLNLRREIGDRRGEGWMLHAIALEYDTKNSHGLARDYMLNALGVARDLEDKELLKACYQSLEKLLQSK